jgi:ABC-type glutathione transport system ATPase component
MQNVFERNIYSDQVKLIVDNIISRSGLLPHCTKIVSTHNKMLLAAADHVIVLRSGRIVANGTMGNQDVIDAAREYVGWHEGLGQQQQQQQQQQRQQPGSAVSSAQHHAPLPLSGLLFDYSSTMRLELRETLQKDVYALPA